MSDGKRYALFFLAMLVWVVLYTAVIRPAFFPEDKTKIAEEPEEVTDNGEKKASNGEPTADTGKEKNVAEETERDDSAEALEEEGEPEGEETETLTGTAEEPAEKEVGEFTFDLFDKEFTYSESESIPGEKLVYEYMAPDDVIISKIYTINTPAIDDEEEDEDPKKIEPYITNLTVRIENKGEREFKQKGYLISAGTVSLLNPGSSSRDVSFVLQRASTDKSKTKKGVYTELEDNVGGIEWAAVTNKYFISVIEPVTDDASDTKKLITRVVMNAFEPSDEAENGADGVVADSAPHLENDYLSAMFQKSGGSVSNFILHTNKIIRGKYDEEGYLDRKKNVVLHPTVIPDRHRPFAISSYGIEEKEKKTETKKLNYSIAIGVGEFKVPPGETLEHKYRLYVGPKEYRRLKRLGYENAVNFNRWLRPINIGFLAILHWLYSIIPNYGVSILILTLLMKLVLFPLDQKSYKSMKEMQKIQPLIAELKAKYKDDPKKAQVKQMELFREHKVNPLGGCLPMLLQFPVLIAMFTTLRVAFELRGASFLWISDLSQPDALWTFPGGGFWKIKSLNILPLIMVVTFYFQQKMSATAPKDPNDPQYKQQQMMSRVFPLMFGFIFYNMQSGLTLYFTFSTFLRILQQLWVNKQPDK